MLGTRIFSIKGNTNLKSNKLSKIHIIWFLKQGMSLFKPSYRFSLSFTSLLPISSFYYRVLPRLPHCTWLSLLFSLLRIATAPQSSLSLHLRFPRVLLNHFVNAAQLETNPWDTLPWKQGSYQRLLWSSHRSNSKGKGLPMAKGQYEDQRDWTQTQKLHGSSRHHHTAAFLKSTGVRTRRASQTTNGWPGQVRRTQEPRQWVDRQQTTVLENQNAAASKQTATAMTPDARRWRGTPERLAPTGDGRSRCWGSSLDVLEEHHLWNGLPKRTSLNRTSRSDSQFKGNSGTTHAKYQHNTIS